MSLTFFDNDVSMFMHFLKVSSKILCTLVYHMIFQSEYIVIISTIGQWVYQSMDGTNFEVRLVQV